MYKLVYRTGGADFCLRLTDASNAAQPHTMIPGMRHGELWIRSELRSAVARGADPAGAQFARFDLDVAQSGGGGGGVPQRVLLQPRIHPRLRRSARRIPGAPGAFIAALILFALFLIGVNIDIGMRFLY